MKKYVNPMLQVVSIKKNDIITGSVETMGISSDAFSGGSSAVLDGGRRMDDWDAGY